MSAGASVVTKKNAALTVEWRPPDALTPYPRNARILSSKAVAKVAASIKAFGLDFVTGLCERLIEGGVPGLHFYTLNQAGLTSTLWQRLGLG